MSKLFLTELAEVITTPRIEKLVVVKGHGVMEAARYFLKPSDDILWELNEWVDVTLSAFSLSVITKHKSILRILVPL